MVRIFSGQPDPPTAVLEITRECRRCLLWICSALNKTNLWQNPYNREMTTILPIITSGCLLLAISPLAVGDEPTPEIAGDALVSAAVETLLQQPSLEAKIRQRATVFGQLV